MVGQKNTRRVDVAAPVSQRTVKEERREYVCAYKNHADESTFQRRELIRPSLISERANRILPSRSANFCEDSERIGGMVGG